MSEEDELKSRMKQLFEFQRIVNLPEFEDFVRKLDSKGLSCLLRESKHLTLNSSSGIAVTFSLIGGTDD